MRGCVTTTTFAVVVAVHVAPRPLRAAKKARNQALPALLMGLCVVAAAHASIAPTGEVVTLHALLTATVLVLAGLRLFMGGRILAPAVAGEFYRQGPLAGRTHPGRIWTCDIRVMSGSR